MESASPESIDCPKKNGILSQCSSVADDSRVASSRERGLGLVPVFLWRDSSGRRFDWSRRHPGRQPPGCEVLHGGPQQPQGDQVDGERQEEAVGAEHLLAERLPESLHGVLGSPGCRGEEVEVCLASE